MTLTIAAARVLTGDGDLGPGWVQADPASGLVTGLGAGPPPVEPDVRLGAGVLAPGLVDAQVNGAFGIDLADVDPAAWAAVARRLPEHGVTSFVPTLITAPLERLEAALRTVAARRPPPDPVADPVGDPVADPVAARVIGVHVEGPFLAERRKGAHRAEWLRDPVPGAVARLVEAGGPAFVYHTLAPERPGALPAIRALVAAGVRVAVGHSDATEAVVHAAADAGATLVTHLYNAMRPMHHRDPGVVGAALVDERLTAGLIVDGHHVQPAAVRVAFAAAPGRIMLVTDAVAALGMPDGVYELGGERIVVREGEPPRRTDGTIAGAAGRLDDAVGLAVAAGVPLRAAVEAATRVPAAAVGQDRLGRIAPGGPADLVHLAPAAGHPLRARTTWIGGRRVHHDGSLSTPES